MILGIIVLHLLIAVASADLTNLAIRRFKTTWYVSPTGPWAGNSLQTTMFICKPYLSILCSNAKHSWLASLSKRTAGRSTDFEQGVSPCLALVVQCVAQLVEVVSNLESPFAQNIYYPMMAYSGFYSCCNEDQCLQRRNSTSKTVLVRPNAQIPNVHCARGLTVCSRSSTPPVAAHAQGTASPGTLEGERKSAGCRHRYWDLGHTAC